MNKFPSYDLEVCSQPSFVLIWLVKSNLAAEELKLPLWGLKERQAGIWWDLFTQQLTGRLHHLSWTTRVSSVPTSRYQFQVHNEPVKSVKKKASFIAAGSIITQQLDDLQQPFLLFASVLPFFYIAFIIFLLNQFSFFSTLKWQIATQMKAFWLSFIIPAPNPVWQVLAVFQQRLNVY